MSRLAVKLSAVCNGASTCKGCMFVERFMWPRRLQNVTHRVERQTPCPHEPRCDDDVSTSPETMTPRAARGQRQCPSLAGAQSPPQKLQRYTNRLVVVSLADS